MSKRLSLVFVVLLLFGCAVTGPETVSDKDKSAEQAQPKVDPKAATEYEAALSSMKAGDNARAEEQFRNVIRAFPEYSGPHTNLGILYFRSERMDEAKSEFNQALELNPRSVVSLNHLGIISRGEGNFKEAYDYYEKALQIDPNYAYAHLNFGILLELYMGKLPEALEHYKRYQELTKEDKQVNGWIVDLSRRIKK